MSNDTPRQSPPFFLERASFWVTNLLYLGAFSCLGGLVERERGLLIGSLVTMIIGYVPVGWLLMDRGARRNPPPRPDARRAPPFPSWPAVEPAIPTSTQAPHPRLPPRSDGQPVAA